MEWAARPLPLLPRKTPPCPDVRAEQKDAPDICRCGHPPSTRIDIDGAREYGGMHVVHCVHAALLRDANVKSVDRDVPTHRPAGLADAEVKHRNGREVAAVTMSKDLNRV